MSTDEVSDYVGYGGGYDGGDEEGNKQAGYFLAFVVVCFMIWFFFIRVPSADWVVGDWGSCPVPCGNGVQLRDVSCPNGYACDLLVKPLDSQACDNGPCWSQTDKVGGTGGNAFDYKCADGKYINKINYRAGWGVDGLSVECNDGKSSSLYGGTGGSPGTYSNDSGYTTFTLTGNSLVGNISQGATADLTKGGSALGSWGGTAKTLSCPSGSKVAGIYGRSESYVDQLGFNCYKFQ